MDREGSGKTFKDREYLLCGNFSGLKCIGDAFEGETFMEKKGIREILTDRHHLTGKGLGTQLS